MQENKSGFFLNTVYNATLKINVEFNDGHCFHKFNIHFM